MWQGVVAIFSFLLLLFVVLDKVSICIIQKKRKKKDIQQSSQHAEGDFYRRGNLKHKATYILEERKLKRLLQLERTGETRKLLLSYR
jgi:hypothetical protein